MSTEGRWMGCGAVTVAGLAVVSSISPQADAVVTVVVLGGLGVGAAACAAGYVVHVRRIRRDIEERESRGESLLRPVDPPPPRRAPCPAAGRRSRRRTATRRSPGRCRHH